MNRVYPLAIFKVAVQPWTPLISRTLFVSSAFALYCCLLQIPWSLMKEVAFHIVIYRWRCIFLLKISMFSVLKLSCFVLMGRTQERAPLAKTSK